ncbi:UNKNOWN [Stylonychia lemnae]|uniref:Uncharacterized protein n=1 Tax=Stylonychia lemnae TaxID=5949 RepID=A0A078A0S6_STYLE|nr:UNKNOWN [Stylonychia lemnae]|eukprot:CDW75806.1 UNKNOWN [Stylonychia lemnae]
MQASPQSIQSSFLTIQKVGVSSVFQKYGKAQQNDKGDIKIEGIVSPKRNKQEASDYQQMKRKQLENQLSPPGSSVNLDLGDKQYNISEESKINSSIPQFPKKQSKQQHIPYLFDPSPRTSKNTQFTKNSQNSFKTNRVQPSTSGTNNQKYVPQNLVTNNKFEQRNSVMIKTQKSPGIEGAISSTSMSIQAKTNSGNKCRKDELQTRSLNSNNPLQASNFDDMDTNYGIENDRQLIRNSSQGSNNKKIQKSMSAKEEVFQTLGMGISSPVPLEDKYGKMTQRITEMDDNLYTTDMVDEFNEGHKYLHEHIKFDHQSMFLKDASDNSFQSMRPNNDQMRINQIGNINWNNLVHEYRTQQSPSKKQREDQNPKLKRIKKELLQEVKLIQQDGEAIVANQGKGFFSRSDPQDISPANLELLLPQYQEENIYEYPVTIEFDYQDENNLCHKISLQEKSTLLRSFMQIKQLDVKYMFSKQYRNQLKDRSTLRSIGIYPIVHQTTISLIQNENLTLLQQFIRSKYNHYQIKTSLICKCKLLQNRPRIILALFRKVKSSRGANQ